MYPVGFSFLDLERTDVPHLWVVIAEPDSDERVLVSITSDKPHLRDRSCPLEVGDHEFIQHLSFPLFRQARVVTQRDISVWMQRGNLVVKATMRAEVVERLRKAAVASDYTPRFVRAAIDECWWSP